MGDLVHYDLNEDGTGVIYEIFPRINYLSRKAIKTRGASFRGERLEQIIASNIDNIFIVTSTLEPDFNNKTLDRFLVACESAHIKTNISINKTDLADESSVKAWADLYKKIGTGSLVKLLHNAHAYRIIPAGERTVCINRAPFCSNKGA